jgi:predicted ATPase
MSHSLEELIKILKKKKDLKEFQKYIEYIRFPHFKNLEPNTKITFDFPLTVFVGQNGCGKSSALQAVQGCPYGYSTGNFWFSTKVDPIPRGKEKPSLIHAYILNNQIVESLKTRVGTKKGADYFEPSRPIDKYGMDILNRFEPIRKNCLYLDFRSVLSAFDKYFHFITPRITKTIKTKQDYIRRYSKNLLEVLKSSIQIKTLRGKERNRKKISLQISTVEIINNILGKEYKSCILLEHSFYQDWGFSVYFETDNFNYSEAFAGSGEFAVVRLVYEVLDAPEESLILLDEPEVSLHPGAQEKLKIFLLEQIKIKKHQIVISTHSPTLISGLPPNAIKVFYQLPNGKFHVDNERTPEEAFYFIGFPNPSKKTIYVEDKLAKHLIDFVIKAYSDKAKEDCFDVIIIPGGNGSMKKHIATYAQNNNYNVYFYFDGDKRKEHFNISGLIENNRNTAYLKEIISVQTNCKFDSLSISINGKSDKEQEDIEILKQYLNYYHSNIKYLPKEQPEEIIWDESVLEKEDICQDKKDKIKSIVGSKDIYKEKFKCLAEEVYGNDASNENFALQEKYVKKWIEKQDDSFQDIKKVLDEMISRLHD